MASNPELDVWNGRFSQAGFVFGTEPNAFLAAQGPRLKPGQTALAVADGEGRNGVWLARQGLDVLSLDFAPHIPLWLLWLFVIIAAAGRD